MDSSSSLSVPAPASIKMFKRGRQTVRTCTTKNIYILIQLILIGGHLMIDTISSLSISSSANNINKINSINSNNNNNNNNNNNINNNNNNNYYQSQQSTGSSSLSSLLSQTTSSPLSMVPTTLIYNQQPQQSLLASDNTIVKPTMTSSSSSLSSSNFQSVSSSSPPSSPFESTAATSSSLANSIQINSNQRERDDREDIPSATINNHSRNNHQGIRPLQYVDVSALVNRERNSSMSLSPKSRSGLPECATQQVCNAIFVRMNYTQKLCECSANYNWKCSFSPDAQDGHTIELTRKFDKRIYTQIKTCEPLREVRACKSPTDWTLLALQSERSGKAHYVVVCKCPTWAQLEGPYTHNHPPYANIPGIRVYGMLCAHQTARSSAFSGFNPQLTPYPEFPWSEAINVLNSTDINSNVNT